jgi:hypothetical protein
MAIKILNKNWTKLNWISIFVAIIDLIGFISQSTVKELWAPETIGIPKAQNLNGNEYGIQTFHVI